MVTHSSILAWRIPWTQKPGGLQSIGSPRVGHNWSDSACSEFISTHTQTQGSDTVLNTSDMYSRGTTEKVCILVMVIF